MREDIKDLWVQALRSGEYEQGSGELCQVDLRDNTHKYCCLGVLTEIARQHGIEGTEFSVQETTILDVMAVAKFGSDSKQLPRKVTKWAGLNSSMPETTADFGEDSDRADSTMAGLNDTRKWNFEQIADQIEKDWEIL